MLAGKRILVGISGGIAAYKIPELIRLLKKAGAEVCVTTTRNALEFVTPLVLETLSGNKVYTDVFATGNDHTTEHISLPDWADMMIVAPATANVIGKMANGIGDDALTTTFMAMRKPVLIAPAMNDKMFAHPAVQHNLQTLCSFEHVTVMDCVSGFLACGTEGKGRMQEIDTIYDVANAIMEEKTLLGKRVMITAGPTRENIDPVRYISNYSSGKMGIALAEQCACKGAQVTLILGPSNERPHVLFANTLLPGHSFAPSQIISVESANDMYTASMESFAQADIAILCAAVADYTPANVAEQKIKREKGVNIDLHLRPTHDIAASLGLRKQPQQYMAGFALETNDEEANALGKMERKNLDLIVLNSLQDPGAGFGYDTNKIRIYTRKGAQSTFPLKSKTEVARDIIAAIEKEID